jgi:hypothetical protein
MEERGDGHKRAPVLNAEVGFLERQWRLERGLRARAVAGVGRGHGQVHAGHVVGWDGRKRVKGERQRGSVRERVQLGHDGV